MIFFSSLFIDSFFAQMYWHRNAIRSSVNRHLNEFFSFFSVHLFEQMRRRRRRISSAEYTSMWLENSRCCSYVARLRLLIKRMIITFWRFFSLRRWNNTEWAPLWMLTQAHHWCDLLFLIVRPFSTCWRQFPFLRRNLWLLFLTGIFQPWIMPYRFL